MMVGSSASSISFNNFEEGDNSHARYLQEVMIEPQEYFCVKYDPSMMRFMDLDEIVYSDGLSEVVLEAVAKAPVWLQLPLVSQFQQMQNPEAYAEVILDMEQRYVDEFAFCVAYASVKNVPTAEILWENVYWLYAADEFVSYANIIEVDQGGGDFYSTIEYCVLENGSNAWYQYPKNVYYWYVVAPEIAGDSAVEIYGNFWREYLLMHNDISYPLLLEKIQGIEYLWDGASYYQPGDRLWNWSMSLHPTAIEAISYWIGKTVPYGAIGSRPGQAQRIAHEHNGWCGELQRIAVAAQRSLLIPSVAASNVAEDHVWREFYERGWHENDNWWYDGGGAVDKFDVYAYGWGKNMSSIYGWRYDDAIYDITAHYIHPEDRVRVSFLVTDVVGRPIDGARVMVLVRGIKDISWYKLMLWEKIIQVWDVIPEIVKGSLIQQLFSRFETRFEEIPDTVDGVTISVWNYTDANGICSLDLGKYKEYVFLVQAEGLKEPWRLARYNTIRTMSAPTNHSYHIRFLHLRNRPLRSLPKKGANGDNYFSVAFNAVGTQLQMHPLNGDVGRYVSDGRIDFLLLDEKNYQRLKNQQVFSSVKRTDLDSLNTDFMLDDGPWYFVFFNPTINTIMNVNVDLSCVNPLITDYVDIICPTTKIFDSPKILAGSVVSISGVASDDISISIDEHEYVVATNNGSWVFYWNTTGFSLGNYTIIADCADATDEVNVSVIDPVPPSVMITSPDDGFVFTDSMVEFAGTVSDNLDVVSVLISVDDLEPQAVSWNNSMWEHWVDFSTLELGEHVVTVEAFDSQSRIGKKTITVVKNESGHTWGPEFQWIIHTPSENITEVSNVIVYANITSSSPFSLKTVSILVSNQSDSWELPMYRYGEFPIQDRHPEDPRQNLSNTPRFGVELGQCPSGEIIQYSIYACDSANNGCVSSEFMFTVT